MSHPVNERLNGSASIRQWGSSKNELVPAHVRELLNLRRLPAMLTAGQTAALLDCGGEHNIPVLVRAGLLKPLGNPPSNSVKYFAAIEVLELAADVKQLSQIRDAIYEHWHGKNIAKTSGNGRPCHNYIRRHKATVGEVIPPE